MNKKPSHMGRSMVEMLGVLTVIGVLSLAAIAGIPMAITKHQSNLIIEDVKLVGFIKGRTGSNASCRRDRARFNGAFYIPDELYVPRF